MTSWRLAFCPSLLQRVLGVMRTTVSATFTKANDQTSAVADSSTGHMLKVDDLENSVIDLSPVYRERQTCPGQVELAAEALSLLHDLLIVLAGMLAGGHSLADMKMDDRQCYSCPTYIAQAGHLCWV